uniref:Thioredoxin domain-containing protein n=1 Tax=Parastrongyloides trichosuri TaxID=131310 RepID=A0A0N4ZXK0_PARTI
MNFSCRIFNLAVKDFKGIRLLQRKVPLSNLQVRNGSFVSKLITEEELLKGDGSKGKASELLKDKVVGLYVSAGWCPSCRMYTTKLAKFYNEINKDKHQFEVIYISGDENENDMKEYYEEKMGNWLMMKHNLSNSTLVKNECDIKSIPSFVIIDKKGDVVVKDGRNQVNGRGKIEPFALFEDWKKIAL